MDFLINKYFGFLTEQLDFKGPFEYHYYKETYTDFVKGQIVVSIGCEGDYWLNVFRTKKTIPELETGEIKIINVSFKEKVGLPFYKFDRKKIIWNSVSGENFPDKKLWYYYKLINTNPEILQGDFRKTKMLYRFKKLFCK